MKKILLLLVALVCATVSFAQNTVVATLTHGDEIKMFYGLYAFRDAHNAAENGDIINLSGGNFQAVKITKALTIRGAGFDCANPTYISGNFDIQIPTEVTERLSFEGCRMTNTVTVRGTLTNAYFMKNSIQYIRMYDGNQNMVNGTFANCAIFGVELKGKSTMQFVNSFVESFDNQSSESASASFLNCVIHPSSDGWLANNIRSSMLVNCILFGNNQYNSYSLPNSTSAINCVAAGKGCRTAFNDVIAKQNCSYANMDIFKDSNEWNDLTDEAKAKYLGNDGTPVGMFGGMLPYNTTPTYPQITKMNVANKTTADGKLSVEIEVSAAK